MTKVFFDASVIFSAINSAIGGSAKLASLVKNKAILGLTTQTVIDEVKDNAEKIKAKKLIDIDNYVLENNFIVRSIINTTEIKPFEGLVNIKDAHVVAGAILTGSEYLVTLDKKHLLNLSIQSKFKQIKIISPADLLKNLS